MFVEPRNQTLMKRAGFAISAMMLGGEEMMSNGRLFQVVKMLNILLTISDAANRNNVRFIRFLYKCLCQVYRLQLQLKRLVTCQVQKQ